MKANAFGVAAFAILLSLATLAVVMVAPTYKKAPQEPLGVCVVTDPYAFGTDGGGPYAAVRSVTAAKRHDGVLACDEGQFVSVIPK